MDQFIEKWLNQPPSLHLRHRGLRTAVPQKSGIALLSWEPPARIVRPGRCPSKLFDIQQIPWWESMRVRRLDARLLRDAWYTPYHSLEYPPKVSKHSSFSDSPVKRPNYPLNTHLFIAWTKASEYRVILPRKVDVDQTKGNGGAFSASECYVRCLAQHS